MPFSSKNPRTLAAIFESPSDDEDFLGFAMSVPSDSESDDSRDSLASEDSGKPAVRFRSKFVTAELCVAEESDEDTGFYSEGEEPETHTRRSLCVAFRFPTKRLSAKKGEAPKKPQPITTAPPKRRTNEKEHLKRGVSQVSRGMVTRGQKQPLKKEEEEVESPVLNKRAKNIQENKAMLAKLFADLTNMSEVTSSPTKKRRVSEKPPPRRRGVCEGNERRNPSRAARPPEKFGVEERSTSPSRHDRSVRTIDVGKLLEVDELGRSRKKSRASSGKKRRITHVRSVDEITEEELDNVAQRAKDKILDKDHDWECPLCRGICNCSLCRRREGRCATGQLVHLAQHKGHSNVQDYLESIQKDLRA